MADRVKCSREIQDKNPPKCSVCGTMFHVYCVSRKLDYWAKRSDSQKANWLCSSCEVKADTQKIVDAKLKAEKGQPTQAINELCDLVTQLVNNLKELREEQHTLIPDNVTKVYLPTQTGLRIYARLDIIQSC